MLKDLLNQVLPVVTAAGVSISVIIVKCVGDAVIEFVAAKIEDIKNKIGVDKYNQSKEFAKDIWNIVEEHFRITEVIGNITEQKIEMFNDLLLKKVPGLTQEEIDSLRQAVAGEINKGKEIITENAADISNKVTTLSIANEQLKNTIKLIQSTLQLNSSQTILLTKTIEEEQLKAQIDILTQENKQLCELIELEKNNIQVTGV